MLFNSSTFLAFYAVLFPLYWFLHRNLRQRNALLLVASYFFYGSWDWRFLSLIILSTVVDYYCGKRIAMSSAARHRRAFLIVSLIVNLGILGFFKYFGFFVTSFIDLMSVLGIHANYYTLSIILPVGISFYTFQTLSYTIDIYYKKLEPTNSLLNFATFVAFFPQLVAGPIERAKKLLPQIESPTSFGPQQFREGVFLILWGLFKKTLIADRLSVYVDMVFASPGDFTGLQCVVAVLFFAIQIYCDFSGYSDIARGLAKTMGIELMVNFNTPYFSTSIREFWQRWHISLSTWFRDYLYIPLGGSRRGDFFTKRNILIIFLVSGLWHGAAYTFVVWGFLHGLGHIMDPHHHLREKGEFESSLWLNTLGLLWTLLFVNCAWVFFRAESLSDAMTIFDNIFKTFSQNTLIFSEVVIGMSNTEFILSLYVIAILFLSDYFFKDRGVEKVTNSMPVIFRWSYSWFLLLNLILLAPSDSGSFIYFQF